MSCGVDMKVRSYFYGVTSLSFCLLSLTLNSEAKKEQLVDETKLTFGPYPVRIYDYESGNYTIQVVYPKSQDVTDLLRNEYENGVDSINDPIKSYASLQDFYSRNRSLRSIDSFENRTAVNVLVTSGNETETTNASNSEEGLDTVPTAEAENDRNMSISGNEQIVAGISTIGSLEKYKTTSLPLAEPTTSSEPSPEPKTTDITATYPITAKSSIQYVSSKEVYTGVGSNKNSGSESTAQHRSTSTPSASPEPTPDPENTSKRTSEPSYSSEPTIPKSTVQLNEESKTSFAPIAAEPTPEYTSSAKPLAEQKSTVEPKAESVATAEPITQPKSTAKPQITAEPTSEPKSTPEPKSTSEPTPEPKSTAETLPEPKSIAETTPVLKSASEPQPESKSTAEPTPEPKSTAEPTPEPKSTTEPLPESKTTTELTAKPKSTSEPSPEPKSTAEPTPEPKSTSEPTPEPKSNSEPTPEFKSTAEPTPEPKSTAEPTPEPKSTAEPSPESKPTVEPTAEPKSTSEPSPEPKSTAEPTPEPKSSSEPIPEPKSTTEPTPELKSSTEPNPEPKSTAEPTSEPKSTAEPTPEPKSTAEPKPEPKSTAEPSPVPRSTSEPTPEPKSTAEPTPEPKSSSKPTAEPKSTAEPGVTPEPEGKSTQRPGLSPGVATNEPEPEPSPGTAEPDAEPETEPESEFSAFSEPQPEWEIAMAEWRWGWYFLVYVFGALFIVLALFSLLSVVRLWKKKHLLSKNYFMVLNLLIIFKCILRAIYLLVDPFNVNNTFHAVISYFLYSTAFPCITAAFSILFYALLLATKMKVLSAKIQKISVLITIIAFHFVLSLATDVVVGISSDAKVMLLVCQFFYILWGIVLFSGYFYIYRRLHESALMRQRTLTKYTSVPSMSNKNGTLTKNSHPTRKRSKYMLTSAIKVTLVAAAVGLLCVAVELYGIFDVYKVYLAGHIPQPWPWYIYQFLLRVTELLMCSLMVYVASQPIKYRQRKTQGVCYTCCLPFRRVLMCQKDDAVDMDLTSYASNNVMSSNSSDSESKKRKLSKIVKVNCEENGNGPQPCRQTHIVIEDGIVRFKVADDSESTLAEKANSLPDLLHESVAKETEKWSDGGSSGVLNEAYTNTLKDEMSKDHQDVNLQKSYISLGTIGTIDYQAPSIHLADSLEWEYEQAYDRSFHKSDGISVKSLPVCDNTTHLTNSSKENGDV